MINAFKVCTIKCEEHTYYKNVLDNRKTPEVQWNADFENSVDYCKCIISKSPRGLFEIYLNWKGNKTGWAANIDQPLFRSLDTKI